MSLWNWSSYFTKRTRTERTLDALPTELIHHISRFLRVKDFKNLRLVNRELESKSFGAFTDTALFILSLGDADVNRLHNFCASRLVSLIRKITLTNYLRDGHKVWARKTWRVTWHNDIEEGVEARLTDLLTRLTNIRHLSLRDTLIHDPKNIRPDFDPLSSQPIVLPLGDLAYLAMIGRCSDFFSRIQTLKIRTWEMFASEKDCFCGMILACTNLRSLTIVEGVLPDRGPGRRALYYPAQDFLWRFGARVLETPLPKLGRLSIRKTGLVCTSLTAILLAHRATLRNVKLTPSVFMTTAFGRENQELAKLLSVINAMPEGFSISLKATMRGEVSLSRPQNYPEGLNLHLGNLKGAQSLAEWYLSNCAKSVWRFVAGSDSGCIHKLAQAQPDGTLGPNIMNIVQLAAILAIGYATNKFMPYASVTRLTRCFSYLRSTLMKLGAWWLFKFHAQPQTPLAH